MRGIRWALALAIFWPVCAVAQDCEQDDLNQQDINACMAEAYEVADADLNEVWDEAMAYAEGVSPETADLLLTAQRAWLAYRDAACAVDASLWAGGSGEPMILMGCLAMLTEERTEHLREFAWE